MDRRSFLTLAGSGAFVGISGLLGPRDSALAASSSRHRIAYQLPASSEHRWAWTIDDGVSSSSISNYTKLALDDPSIKYTYFVTSMYSSWRNNAPALRELIQRGQVQLANHTHTHKDLRTLTNHGIQKELRDCQHFLEDEFGVAGTPFWRPPYGYFDFRVLAAAAEIGYTAPVMWMGTFGTDSHRATLPGVLGNVQRWVQNGRIVIDHANYPMAGEHLSEILRTIRPKGLKMVTLAEAFPRY